MKCLLTAFVLMFGVAPAAAAEQPLVADLSEHLVKITMGFEGAELLLFGAVEGDGDIVVLVHGPKETLTVRRKARTAGIWMNRDQMTFEEIPAFYRVMATSQPGDWLTDAVRERHQIGVDHLELPLARDPRRRAGAPAADDFRVALIRRKQELGHYGIGVGSVKMLSARLFRSDVLFPTNVPTGTYTVEVLLVRDGEVISAQSTPLYVSKIGVLAEVFGFAHDYSALYGLAAIFFAVLAGLGANAAFRKV
ncbi:MAG: TIGR02186 family protein [Alphaproteobacteria bacterium]|nr:TIGR02186 family protein [Alphaproteobacteria bacterium]